jgi:hypothetical protein
MKVLLVHHRSIVVNQFVLIRIKHFEDLSLVQSPIVLLLIPHLYELVELRLILHNVVMNQ